MSFRNCRALVLYILMFVSANSFTLLADCDVTMNCSACNSGGFTDPPGGTYGTGCGGGCRTIQPGQQTTKIDSGSAVMARRNETLVVAPSWLRTAGLAFLAWPIAFQAAAALSETDLPAIALPGLPVSLAATGKVGERTIENLKITIKNHGQIPITAFVVGWEVDSGLGFRAISATSFDSYMGRLDVQPGQSMDAEGAALTAPSKVYGVRAVLNFVELADGSTKGDNAFASLLKSRRRAQLTVYRDILLRVETDGRNIATKEKVEAALASPELQKTPEGRDTVVILNNLLHGQGAERVLAELRRPRS